MSSIKTLDHRSSGGLLGRVSSYPKTAGLTVLLIGLAVTLTVSSIALDIEQSRIQNNFKLVTLKHLNLLEREIESSILPLETLQAFYRSSDSVYRDEFVSFVEPMLAGYPEVEAFHWIPRVKKTQRSRYERQARREGITGFSIRDWKEKESDQSSDDLFPVYVTHPMEKGRNLLGLNLASRPDLMESLDWACDQSTVAATPPITGGLGQASDPLMFALLPVYSGNGDISEEHERRERLLGYVAATYHADKIVSSTIQSDDERDFDLTVVDLLAPEPDNIIFRIEEPLTPDHDTSTLSHTAVLNLADRLWEARYHPTGTFLHAQESAIGLTALLSGLLITLLLSAGAWAAMRYTAQLRIVTAELGAAKEKLEADMRKRRLMEKNLKLTQFTVDKAADPIYWMGEDARFVYVNEAACRVLGYDKEELLRMTVMDIDTIMTVENWPKHWEELKKFRSFTINSVHKAKSGKLLPVEVTVNLIEFEGQLFNCVHTRDISEQTSRPKQSDYALCSFQNYADNSELGISVISPRKTILYMNKYLKELYPQIKQGGSSLCYEVYNNGASNGICLDCPAERTLNEGATCQAIVTRVGQDKREKVHITTTPIRDKNNEIIAFVETMINADSSPRTNANNDSDDETIITNSNTELS